jgi:hypothetical protein
MKELKEQLEKSIMMSYGKKKDESGSNISRGI